MMLHRFVRRAIALVTLAVVVGGAWSMGMQPAEVVEALSPLLNGGRLVSANEVFSAVLWGVLWMLLAATLVALTIRAVREVSGATARLIARVTQRGVAGRLSAVMALGGSAVVAADAAHEPTTQQVVDDDQSAGVRSEHSHAGQPIGALASVGLAAGLVAHVRNERNLLLRDAPSRQRLARPPAASLTRGATVFARAAELPPSLSSDTALVVPIGMSGDRLVQLQVQRGAFVSVEAPAVESQSVLRHLINTIALAPWLCEPRVVAVGFTRADVVAASNVVFCTDVAAAVTETQRLDRESPQCTIVVVLGDENHDASVLEALGTRGVTVITTSTAMTLPPAKSASPSRVRIQRESMCWRIDTTGEMFRPYGVSAQEADDLRTMVGDLTTLTTTPDRNQAHHTAAPGALLRVLGPVELTLLTGREVSFRKSKSLELVAWLAFHRDRPTVSGVRTALWEVDVEDATFHNVLSEARRGFAHVGVADAVQRPSKQRLELVADLITDADVLGDALAEVDELVAHIAEQHESHEQSERALAVLIAELRSVRALPFSDAQYVWADAEGITANLVWLVTRAVDRAVELAQRCNDDHAVLDAASAGLRMFPGDERWSTLARSTLSGSAVNASAPASLAPASETALCTPPGDAAHRLADDRLAHL
jgi:hypothetical protein